MRTMFFILALISIFANLNSEVLWERQTGATINDVLLNDAYSGGIDQNAYYWPRQTFVDIDNDGDLDLFIGVNSGKILFYRNDGNANNPIWTLITDHYTSIDVGYNAAPTFCDIDNDGDKDLFIGCGMQGNAGGNVIFYKNVGTPEEALWSLVTDSLASIDASDNSVPTFCDIDGDNDYDLFVGNGHGWITFARNIGTPTVAQWDTLVTNYHSISVTWKNAPTFADIDNDGDMDLFIGSYSGYICFYRNDGTQYAEQWAPATYGYIPRSGFNIVPCFADIDNDNDLDLFVIDYCFGFNMYENTGTPESATWSSASNFALTSLDFGFDSIPTFCDIDNDGDMDLFIGNGDGRIYTIINSNNPLIPNWETNNNYNIIDSGDYSAPEFCDIDNDGDMDLFIGAGTQYADSLGIIFYENNGTPEQANFVFVTDAYNSIYTKPYNKPKFCDIDNDGDMDLFITSENYADSSGIYFYKNNGSSENVNFTFITKTYMSIHITGRNIPTFFDIDNDGDMDLFIGCGWGQIYFYKNEGTPEEASFILITETYNSIEIGYGYAYPVFTDIDSDGDMDLFVGESNGGIRFWRNMGNVSNDDNTIYPDKLELTNYPNPFNPSTTISFNLEKANKVNLSVYNIKGQKVKTLVDQNLNSGNHKITWNGKDDNNKNVASGIYFYKLETYKGSLTKKMILMK